MSAKHLLLTLALMNLIATRNGLCCRQTETELPMAPNSMCLFWKHLPQATWTCDDKVLQLAAGTHFMGKEEFGDKLMLRDCYSNFEAIINEHFAGSGKGFAVIGSPGKEQADKLLLKRIVGCRRVQVVCG